MANEVNPRSGSPGSVGGANNNTAVGYSALYQATTAGEGFKMEDRRADGNEANPQVADAATQADHGGPRRVIIGEDALVRHLNMAHEMDMAHVAKAKAENERHLEEQKKAAAEDREAHWARVLAHQAEQNRIADERLRVDRLHRLYTMYLDNLLRAYESRESDGSDIRYALESARKAQAYFEKAVRQ